MSIQSERILKTIKEKNISYGDLSKLTGIAKSALQRYATGETTKIPLDRIEIIARVLNVSPAYIMGWSDFPNDKLVKKNPSAVVDKGIQLYKQLDVEDKAEIRGEMKHMLKAAKYNKPSISAEIADDITKLMNMPTHTKSK